MYSKAIFSNDLKEINSLINIIDSNFKEIKEITKIKEFDTSFYWKSVEMQIMLNEYKKVYSRINIQELYSQTLDSQLEELLNILKTLNNKYLSQKSEIDSMMPIIINYTNISEAINTFLDSLNNILEISNENKNYFCKLISKKMIQNKILPPELDENYEFVDFFLEIVESIKDSSLETYITNFNKILNEDEENNNYQDLGNSLNSSNFIESGIEVYQEKINESNNDFENLESILKNMKKNKNF